MMKKLITIFAIILSLTSCEDVIDVDLTTESPRLVIDASIEWQKGTSGNVQEIKLSLTAPYFDEVIPPATNAVVTITNSNNTVFQFVEDGDTGIYRTSNFIPMIGETYRLDILYDGQLYTGTETLKSVVPIDFIEQTSNGGFTGEDIEIKAYYTDPETEQNFYFFQFQTDITAIPILEVYEDEFTNGNQIFGYYTEEDLTAGDVVDIKIQGISEAFYNYMFVILQQNSEVGGGPFETQPATVRGNCVNSSDADHFPLGYFRLGEVDKVQYTVE